MATLSIIIPCFDEESTIHAILQRVLEVELDKDIQKQLIVVDDGSRDSTRARIEEFMQIHRNSQIQLSSHKRNMGKGAAIRTGISMATGNYILIQDADLEYDPKEYRNLLEPIIEDKADVVFGSRFVGGKPHRVLFFWHSIGNRLLTFISNMMTNLNLTDMETCYKVFKSEVIKSIHLKENRFGFEPEVTAKISKIPGIRIYEVGVSYYGRKYNEGKKINWRDGFRAIFCILKYNIWDR